MFKLESLDSGHIVKSFNIYKLQEFIILHPDFEYQFYIGFTPLTTDDFLKYYLHETNNYQEYMQLFRILKTLTTSKEILDKWLNNGKL